MSVNNLLNVGVQGVLGAQQDITQASNNLSQLSVSSTQANTEAPSVSAPTTNITQEIIALRVGELQAKANTNTIVTADEMLGTLIDIRA